MRLITKRSILSLMVILALLATSIAGCNLNDTDTAGAPTIPPESTFIIDFDDFNSEGATTAASVDTATVVQSAGFTFGDDYIYSSDQYAAANKQNWQFAAGTVGGWSLLLLVGLAVPKAAFTESFKHTPQQQKDYTWVWSYDVTVGVFLYSPELHGRFIDDYNDTDAGVRWDMYISKQGDYEEFHWFYGESNLTATEGFWIIKNNADDPTDLTDDPIEIIRINWKRDPGEGTYSIKYTNIVPDGPENGGYIRHGATTDEFYDLFFEIHNKAANTYTYIEWNSTTKEGRVKAKHHFGNDVWYCWNYNHQNTDCS